MLWTHDDSGYLVSVDLPETARCRMCGIEYKRSIRDAKPWQQSVPDRCPKCRHENASVDGISFENFILPA